MLKCECCGKETSNDTYLFNHILRFSQYDEEHKNFFRNLLKQIEQLFYDVNFSSVTIHDPQTITIDYASAKKLWKQEFGEEAVKERSAIVKNRNVAIGVIAQQNKCSREQAEKKLVKKYDLSHIKHDNQKIVTKKEYDINTPFCPVCGKSFGRSLLNHCKVFFQTHKEFLEQQKQLIIPLFYNYDINKNIDLKQFNIFFNYSYCQDIWLKYYGFNKIEEKRKILEQKTKLNKNRIINHCKGTGKIKALHLDEYENDFVVPDVSFSYKEICNNGIKIDNVCPFCNADISRTTIWNHCVLNRSEKQHNDFLLEQMNISLQLFNDLSFNVNKKEEYTNRNLYIGPQTIKALWEKFFKKSLFDERKSILRKQSILAHSKLLPYSKSGCVNPYITIDWSQFDIEKIKDEKLNLNYDADVFDNVRRRICPICHKPTERLLFEHLKLKRLDQEHLKMFEEQIKLAIKLFFCKDKNKVVELQHNLLIPLETCKDTIYANLFQGKMEKI